MAGKLTAEQLAQLLEDGFKKGVNLEFYIPQGKPPPKSWDEVLDAAHLAYSTALMDVFQALDGDEAYLRDAFSEEGRMAFVDADDLGKFVKMAEELSDDESEAGD